MTLTCPIPLPATAADRRAAIATRITVARVALGWSQGDLARACDVTQQTISRTEAARSEPRLYLRDRLADALGMSVEELFA